MIALGLLMVPSCWTESRAGLVTSDFDVVVTQVSFDPSFPTISYRFEVGEIVHVSLNYDPESVVDTHPDPALGDYLLIDNPGLAWVTASTERGFFTSFDSLYALAFVSDGGPDLFVFQFHAPSRFFELRFADPTGLALDSDDLPGASAVMSFPELKVWYDFDNGGAEGFRGTLVGAPEPPTWLLCSVGIVLAALYHRRKGR
jgi:hypothetical protein